MFRFALSTFGAKLLTSLINFILIIIASNYLGAAAVGEISLILLTVAIVVMASFIIGGNAIVYLTPRYNIFPIIVITYGWSLIVSVLTYIILANTALIDGKYTIHVVILSLIASLFSVHFNILLGKEKIHHVNLLSVTNVLIILLVFSFFVFVKKQLDVWSYIAGMYIAYVIIYAWSAYFVFRFKPATKAVSFGKILKDLFKYGVLLQFANIALLLNYRGGYYFVEHFYSKASLGVYSVGNQLVEASWMISRSFSTVLYARVSNLKNDDGYGMAKFYVLSFFKIVFVITLGILIVLLAMPVSVYTFVFGEEFSMVKDIIIALSPGILLFSVSRILGVFFSGTGRAAHFSLGTFLSLALLTVLLYLWVPVYGIIGAAWATSVSYSLLFLYYITLFVYHTRSKFGDFIINKQDLELFITETKKLFKLKSNES